MISRLVVVVSVALLVQVGMAQEKGACCFESGTCAVISQPDCADEGGLFQGEGTVCAVGLCAQPTGGCCLDSGECLPDLTQAECNAIGGGADWQGPGAACVEGLCVPIKGACCFTDGFLCAAMSQADCNGGGGLYQGDGTVCQPGLCLPAAQADLNGDHRVDVYDLIIVVLDWSCEGSCQGDVDRSGATDSDDLLAVLAHWEG